MNKVLSVSNLSKNYNTIDGEIKALDNISFDVYNEEFIAIVGSSGCGKSTILSILSGLIKDYDGLINTYNKKIGYMLQTDCLLPWLSIWENAILGLKLTNDLTKENISNVKKLLIKYNLYDFKDKYPTNLSGGMKQRVV